MKIKGVCAIVLNSDRIYISCAILKRNYLEFIKEIEIAIPRMNNDSIIYLKENSEIINQKIKLLEEKYRFRVEKTFLELPWNITNKRIVEESYALKRRKRITSRDIFLAKNNLEDKFLDWDDFCVHNVALSYEVEGVRYNLSPIGVQGRKIKIRSMLVWVKDKIRKEVEDVFDNLDRNFCGFVSPQLSMFFSSFTKKEKTQVVVSLDYDSSRIVVRDKDDFFFKSGVDFGLKKTIEDISKRFLLDENLAEQVFSRYVSFKEIPYFKEITVKNNSGYLNLSTQSLNSFMKSYIKNKIPIFLDEIKKVVKDDNFTISFIGRLNEKEGFYAVLRDCMKQPLKIPIQKSILSSSYGCLRYGIHRFLEKDYKKNESLFQHILNIYKGYF